MYEGYPKPSHPLLHLPFPCLQLYTLHDFVFGHVISSLACLCAFPHPVPFVLNCLPSYIHKESYLSFKFQLKCYLKFPPPSILKDMLCLPLRTQVQKQVLSISSAWHCVE